MYIENYILFS